MSETFLIKKTAFNVTGLTSERDANSFIIGPGELNGPAGLARDSDLKLYGFGSLKWGEGVNQNIYRLLENNACPAKVLNDYNPDTGNNDYDPSTDPLLPQDENDLGTGNGITTPVYGQHWFNSTNSIMYTYSAAGWTTVFNEDGSLTITGTLDMVNFQIVNLADPTLSTDGLNLGFADTRYVNVAGDTMTGILTTSAAINANANIVMGAGSVIDMGSNQINSLADPTVAADGLNLGFADTRYVNVTGDTMTGVLTMSSNIDMNTTNRVINLAEPTATQHAATKNYVDTEISTVAVGFMPVGSVMAFAGLVEPAGWELCNGSTISRTVHAALFAVIADSYGIGDGSTTFNLPDYRGEFLRGWDNAAGNDPDAAGRTDRGDGTAGDVVGSKQLGQNEAHTHNVTFNKVPQGSSGTGASRVHDTGYTDATTSSGGNESRPRNVNVMYIIYSGV